MALFKLLRANDGKGGTTTSTGTHEQVAEGRVYTPSASIITGSGPFAQYLFDDADFNTSAVDSAGSADLLKTTIAAATASGVTDLGNGNGISLKDGIVGQDSMYRSAAGVSGPDLYAENTGEVSYAFWFKEVERCSNNENILNMNDFALNAVQIFYPSTTSDPDFRVYDDAGNTSQSFGSTLTLGAWYHMVLTYKVSTKTMQAYVNGTLLTGGTTVNTGTGDIDGNSANSRLSLGITATAAGEMLFDQFLVFDRILTAQEVTNLATVPAAPTQEDLTIPSGDTPADGDVVYLTASGEVSPADASDSTKSEVIGFYEDTDDSVQAKRGSEITGFNVQTAITMATGDIAYLSSSEAGKITNVATSTAGESVVKLGTMESATKLILDIEFMYTN